MTVKQFALVDDQIHKNYGDQAYLVTFFFIVNPRIIFEF